MPIASPAPIEFPTSDARGQVQRVHEAAEELDQLIGAILEIGLVGESRPSTSSVIKRCCADSARC
ncbi:MAG: hypothetical protein KatS3mg082_1105 [Nitrospiraceae bacterium]|nr:MAG: hypothetical protein KatS3mg082_1105 [Nitrospiraceae bacterium]